MEITCGITGETLEAVFNLTVRGKKNLTLFMLFNDPGGCHKISNCL
jgi:hypothetical protein